MKILLDNGHGVDTPGKRSPDGALREYAWNRLITARIGKDNVILISIHTNAAGPDLEADSAPASS